MKSVLLSGVSRKIVCSQQFPAAIQFRTHGTNVAVVKVENNVSLAAEDNIAYGET